MTTTPDISAQAIDAMIAELQGEIDAMIAEIQDESEFADEDNHLIAPRLSRTVAMLAALRDREIGKKKYHSATMMNVIAVVGDEWISAADIARKMGRFCADGSPDYNPLYPQLYNAVFKGLLEIRTSLTGSPRTFYRKRQLRSTESAAS